MGCIIYFNFNMYCWMRIVVYIYLSAFGGTCVFEISIILVASLNERIYNIACLDKVGQPRSLNSVLASISLAK